MSRTSFGGTDASPLRVLARPAFATREHNPYNALLYEQLSQLGVLVDEWDPARLRSQRHDVVHLHWPERVLDEPWAGMGLVRLCRLLQNLAFCKRRRIKIVWTVHNLASHSGRHRRLEAILWWCFPRLVDGTIHLSEPARMEALERFPALRRRPSFVVAHGHYREAYPASVTRDEARSRLGVSPGTQLLLFFGQIHEYKNVVPLIRAFRSLPCPEGRLLVAGAPGSTRVAREVLSAAAGDPRVELRLGFVPDPEVPVCLVAADLLVIPYRTVLNSGTALLALSFARPVLVPALGSLPELKALVGEEYVHTYTGPINSEVLQEALRWLRTTRRDAPPNLEHASWSRIASQTLDAYRQVIGLSS